MGKRTFLPSGIVERSTSTLAMAKTSAEADMLTKKSVQKREDQHLVPMGLILPSHRPS